MNPLLLVISPIKVSIFLTMVKLVLVAPGITVIAFEREYPPPLAAINRPGYIFLRAGIGPHAFVRHALFELFVTGSSTVFRTGNYCVWNICILLIWRIVGPIVP
jgi:hypothetical protein